MNENVIVPIGDLVAMHDAAVVGAAVKLILAMRERPTLELDEQRRASGLTHYIWERHGPQVVRLAEHLEPLIARA